MVGIDSNEVLQGPFIGIVTIFMQYHMWFFMALVPQLHLWLLHLLVLVQSVGVMYSCVP
jgi:hypothetical protein